MATTTANKNVKPATKAVAKKPKVKEPDLYFWEGKNQKGQVVRGEIKAHSLVDVKNQLRKQGQLKPKSRKNPNRFLVAARLLHRRISLYLCARWRR